MPWLHGSKGSVTGEGRNKSASGDAARAINLSDVTIALLSQNCTGPTDPYQCATLEGSSSSM